MLADEHVSGASQGSDAAAPWAGMLRRHRADWVASLAGQRPVVEFRDAPGLGGSRDSEEPGAGLAWIDELPADEASGPLMEAIRTVAARGRPLVVGLHADGRGESASRAERLAEQLGGLLAVQHLAAGSLILGEPDARATIEEPGDPDKAVHFLVCVNLPPPRTEAVLGARVVPLMSGYVKFLEEANRSLSEANARFAREHLGIHDAAAAALEPRVAELERKLKDEREVAQQRQQMLLQAEAALKAPRYRLVDAARDVVFKTPGLASIFRARSRLIQRRTGR